MLLISLLGGQPLLQVILDSTSSTRNTGATPGSIPQDNTSNPKVLVVSAMSERGLDQHIDSVLKYLEHKPDSICDLAFTFGMRRDHLPHRAFTVAGGEEKTEPTSFQRSTLKHQNIPTFLFTGQAAHWPGMGTALVATFPTFKSAIRGLDQALKDLKDAPEWSIEGIYATLLCGKQLIERQKR